MSGDICEGFTTDDGYFVQSNGIVRNKEGVLIGRVEELRRRCRVCLTPTNREDLMGNCCHDDCPHCREGWHDPIGPCDDGSYITMRPCSNCFATGRVYRGKEAE